MYQRMEPGLVWSTEESRNSGEDGERVGRINGWGQLRGVRELTPRKKPGPTWYPINLLADDQIPSSPRHIYCFEDERGKCFPRGAVLQFK